MAVTMATATAPAATSQWIVSPVVDSVFIIGGPLLVLAVLLPLAQVFSAETVGIFVLAVMGTGHHFFGFLRAYGDPVLFERYRLRFLLAPPLVFVAVFSMTRNNLHGVILLAGFWAAWHLMKQVYGVMRIYGAKRGEHRRATMRLDFLMCLTGFATMLAFSDTHSQTLISTGERTGIFITPLLFGQTAKILSGVAMVGVSSVYVAHTWAAHRRGAPIAPVKLALLASSLVFLYYSWGLAGGALFLGIAAFEAAHYVQYAAVAWSYSRRLSEKGGASRLLAALSQPRVGLIILYVLAAFAYGAAFHGKGPMAHEFGSIGASLIASSAILHFYFDGFIWKVRQKGTRDNFGIGQSVESPASEDRVAAAGLPPFSWRGEATQLLYLAVPLAVLTLIGANRTDFELPMRQAVVFVEPGSARLQFALGDSYQKRGRLRESIAAYQESIRLDSVPARAYNGLGQALMRTRDREGAVTALRDALDRNPSNKAVMATLAGALVIDPASPSDLREAKELAKRADAKRPPSASRRKSWPWNDRPRDP